MGEGSNTFYSLGTRALLQVYFVSSCIFFCILWIEPGPTLLICPCFTLGYNLFTVGDVNQRGIYIIKKRKN